MFATHEMGADLKIFLQRGGLRKYSKDRPSEPEVAAGAIPLALMPAYLTQCLPHRNFGRARRAYPAPYVANRSCRDLDGGAYNF